MKLRKGAEELVNVKDAVHGSETDTLHDYVNLDHRQRQDL